MMHPAFRSLTFWRFYGIEHQANVVSGCLARRQNATKRFRQCSPAFARRLGASPGWYFSTNRSRNGKQGLQCAGQRAFVDDDKDFGGKRCFSIESQALTTPSRPFRAPHTFLVRHTCLHLVSQGAHTLSNHLALRIEVAGRPTESKPGMLFGCHDHLWRGSDPVILWFSQDTHCVGRHP